MLYRTLIGKFLTIKSALTSSKGLTANQIKWIALICMTIDHTAASGFPFIYGMLYDSARIIGRLAAPLFLFLITESIHYTRSKPRFVLRLYISSVFVGLFSAITNLLFGNIIGKYYFSNIIFTFFYTALYILVVENFISLLKKRNFILATISLSLLILPFKTSYINEAFWAILNQFNLNSSTITFIRDIYYSFVQDAINVEYSFLFVIMGILVYFSPKKIIKCSVIVVFCVICFIASQLQPEIFPLLLLSFFGRYQYLMVLSLPFILLYNGQKGRSQKYFFYIYYPLHRYILVILSFLTRL